jgi:hypothetical protein
VTRISTPARTDRRAEFGSSVDTRSSNLVARSVARALLARVVAHFHVARHAPIATIRAPPPLAATQERDGMATASVDRVKRKLSERIAQIRGERSQRQFARDLGVFQQNVNRYESGTTPHTDFLITLAIKENVSMDWLLLGRGKMRRGARP